MTDINVSSTDIIAKWENVNAFSWRNYPSPWAIKEFALFLAQIGEEAFFSEGLGKTFVKSIIESLGFADEKASEAVQLRTSLENIKFLESVKYELEKNIFENFKAGDAAKKELTTNIFESIGIGEEKSDPSVQITSFYEKIHFVESVKFVFEKHIAEQIGVAEAVIEPFAQGVVSDIGLLNTLFDEDDLEELTLSPRPIGFGEWKRFTEGEYTHKEALFRLRILNSEPESVKSVEVTEHKIICDVYDVVESRVSSITGGETATRISFNKTFHSIPIVTAISINTATFCIADITEITKEYFDVKLKTADSYINGSISWQAHGY